MVNGFELAIVVVVVLRDQIAGEINHVCLCFGHFEFIAL